MAKLKAAKRKKLKSSQFALPGQRKYPIHDKSHAANAKARAHQQLNRGNLSQAEYRTIVSKANKVLGLRGGTVHVKGYDRHGRSKRM